MNPNLNFSKICKSGQLFLQRSKIWRCLPTTSGSFPLCSLFSSAVFIWSAVFTEVHVEVSTLPSFPQCNILQNYSIDSDTIRWSDFQFYFYSSACAFSSTHLYPMCKSVCPPWSRHRTLPAAQAAGYPFRTSPTAAPNLGSHSPTVSFQQTGIRKHCVNRSQCGTSKDQLFAWV